MYRFLISFDKEERQTLVSALELFISSRKVVYSFGKIVIDDDSVLESLRPLLTRDVCFVSCLDLDDSFRFGDYLRALKFRYCTL